MSAAATLVSEQEYLALTGKPNCEYLDGVVIPKPMPTFNHSELQFQAADLVRRMFPEFVTSPELTLRIREGRFLIPDVAVQHRADVQKPYPVRPIPLCIEILSPDDRLTAVLSKCDEYLDWGVPMTWILDPENRVAYEYPATRVLHEIPAGSSLTAGPIAIPISRLFAGLESEAG